MPAIDSTIVVTEPGYGERVVRVHGGFHQHGVSHTSGVDLVTGERLLVPVSTRWDFDAKRSVRVCADGWSWRQISLADAERRAGLPQGSLPARSETTRTDLWADQRMRNPAFIALLTLLSEHSEVVFYTVDWRSWVHLAQPRVYPLREDSPLLRAPDQTRGLDHGRHVPYPLGGSGDMERYASYISTLLSGASTPAVEEGDETYETLSEAVLADLHQRYDEVVQWQRRSQAHSRLHYTQPADMPIVRSLAEIQALAGWTPALLDQLDELYADTRDRLAEETAPYRPTSVALSLF